MARKSDYGQFCPIAMTAEILAVRWTPLVIRELLCGSHRFSDLQRGLPLMSPSLLSTRLRELEFAGIVERQPAENGKGHDYYLTEGGQELRPIIEAFGLWSQKWLDHEYTEEHLDPSLLMWDIRRTVDCRFMPDDKRIMVEFELHGFKSKQKRWWLMFEDGEADLCNKDPGYEIDLYVKAHIRDLTEIWMGRQRLDTATRSGALLLEGSLRQVRNFPKWFSLNMYATTAPQTNPLATAEAG
jgi:DNA-binding HxlR family transcriptional regulator